MEGNKRKERRKKRIFSYLIVKVMKKKSSFKMAKLVLK